MFTLIIIIAILSALFRPHRYYGWGGMWFRPHIHHRPMFRFGHRPMGPRPGMGFGHRHFR